MEITFHWFLFEPSVSCITYVFYKYDFRDKGYLDGFFKSIFYESVAVAGEIAKYVTLLKEFAQNNYGPGA